MSNILFTVGAKGGTGKSTAARFLITYLRQHGANPLLLDLDDENRTLSRFFPEALQVEIKKGSSHDILVERALNGSSLIIADLKAGTGREVLDWWLDVPFEELRSRGIDFVCLASVTSSPDSVQSFLNWVTSLQDRIRYVVFKNLKDGDYLPDYDESDGALNFRQTLVPHHVVLPRLDDEYVTELERLDLTIAEVLDSSNGISARGKDIGPLLSRLMVRARLRRFQQGIYDQFDPIRQLLSGGKP
jgi:CobQ/CobB/MinD/ParA nucleotide binding domain